MYSGRGVILLIGGFCLFCYGVFMVVRFGGLVFLGAFFGVGVCWVIPCFFITLTELIWTT